MVPGQALTMPQFGLAPVAVLASVTIASKEECVGDLAAEAAGDVDELYESYDGRFGKGQTFASNEVGPVRFDDLGLALDDQTKGTPDRYHGERLKRGV